jgi:hypothetical protein
MIVLPHVEFVEFVEFVEISGTNLPRNSAAAPL